MDTEQKPPASRLQSPHELQWHALYVWSRAEKKVFTTLKEMGIEAYLPLITEMHQWSDRKKKVEMPLFRSYVFVHSLPADQYNILNVSGVLRFVSFGGKPVVVPDNQILAIKKYVDEYEGRAESLDNTPLAEGQAVRIIGGPLRGLVGRLASIKNKRHLIVYIETVGQYLPINITRTKVDPVSDMKTTSFNSVR